MTQYHINEKTGNANICRAKSCELKHYETKAAAEAANGKKAVKQVTTKKTPAAVNREVLKATPKLEAKVKKIETKLEKELNVTPEDAEKTSDFELEHDGQPLLKSVAPAGKQVAEDLHLKASTVGKDLITRGKLLLAESEKLRLEGQRLIRKGARSFKEDGPKAANLVSDAIQAGSYFTGYAIGVAVKQAERAHLTSSKVDTKENNTKN